MVIVVPPIAIPQIVATPMAMAEIAA